MNEQDILELDRMLAEIKATKKAEVDLDKKVDELGSAREEPKNSDLMNMLNLDVSKLDIPESNPEQRHQLNVDVSKLGSNISGKSSSGEPSSPKVTPEQLQELRSIPQGIGQEEAAPQSENSKRIEALQPEQESQENRDAYTARIFKAAGVDDDARSKLASAASEGPSAGQKFLVSLGAGMQGQDQNAAVAGLYKDRDDAKKDLAAFDVRREKLGQGYKEDAEYKKYMQEADDELADSDPNSPQSQAAREYALALGVSPEAAKNMTAASLKKSPYYAKKFELSEKKRLEDRKNSEFDRELSFKEKALNSNKEDRAEDKQRELMTPYGEANTKDDAKKLKDAHEMKSNFDNKIDQLIALRKDKGVEFLDREAVARGKQLSKDLLLQYKDMAKLGVLSVSDEKILNAIIPPDPTAMDWVPGQDSILSNLESFKADSDKDFATRVKTRTKAGINKYNSGDKTESARTVKIQGPDGKVREIPKDKLQAAIKAGGKEVK